MGRRVVYRSNDALNELQRYGPSEKLMKWTKNGFCDIFDRLVFLQLLFPQDWCLVLYRVVIDGVVCAHDIRALKKSMDLVLQKSLNISRLKENTNETRPMGHLDI